MDNPFNSSNSVNENKLSGGLSNSNSIFRFVSKNSNLTNRTDNILKEENLNPNPTEEIGFPLSENTTSNLQPSSTKLNGNNLFGFSAQSPSNQNPTLLQAQTKPVSSSLPLLTKEDIIPSLFGGFGSKPATSNASDQTSFPMFFPPKPTLNNNQTIASTVQNINPLFGRPPLFTFNNNQTEGSSLPNFNHPLNSIPQNKQNTTNLSTNLEGLSLNPTISSNILSNSNNWSNRANGEFIGISSLNSNQIPFLGNFNQNQKGTSHIMYFPMKDIEVSYQHTNIMSIGFVLKKSHEELRYEDLILKKSRANPQQKSNYPYYNILEVDNFPEPSIFAGNKSTPMPMFGNSNTNLRLSTSQLFSNTINNQNSLVKPQSSLFNIPNNTSNSLFGICPSLFPPLDTKIPSDTLERAKCSICKNFNMSYNLTCDHKVCTGCLHKELFFNFDRFFSAEKFEDKINLNCLICEQGYFKLNKTKFVEIFNPELNLEEKEQSSESSGYIDSLECYECDEDDYPGNIVRMYCITCKSYLCLECITNHPKKHTFTNDLNRKVFENYCSYHANEELKFLCKTCSSYICLTCGDINHQGHQIEYINDSSSLKKENLFENLPYKNFDELESYIDGETEKIIYEMTNKSEKFISNINTIILTLHDVISQYTNKIREVEENFKFSIKILKTSYQKFYTDLDGLCDEDYQGLNLFKKITSKFNPSIVFKENFYKNINEFENTLKNLTEKFKDDITNMKEIQIGNCSTSIILKGISCNYRLAQSKKLDSSSNSLHLTRDLFPFNISNSNFIITAGNDQINLWEIKNDDILLNQRLPEKAYDYMPINGGRSDEIFFQSKDKEGVICYKLKYLGGTYSNSFDKILFNIPSSGSKINCLICVNTYKVNHSEVSQTFIYAHGSCEIHIKEFEKNTLSSTYSYHGHSDSVTCLLHVPDRKYLISGSNDESLIVWTFPRKPDCDNIVRYLRSHNNPIYSLLLINNTKFASGCTESINIWSLNNFSCLKQISAHNERIVSLKNLDSNYFVSASHDRTIKIWKSYDEYDCAFTFNKEESKITALEVTQNLEIITTTENKKLNIWKLF